MSNEGEGRQAAEEFRRLHNLGVQPLGDLVAIIEQQTGHEVTILEGEPDEHGLTMRDPASGVTYIGVACTPHPMRQRSTLAHELAHVIFEDWNSDVGIGRRSPEEIRADAFARHLLLPSGGLAAMLGDRRQITEADLAAVVQRFLVSPPLAAIALCNHNYIDEQTKDTWLRLTSSTLATRYGWSDHYQSLQADSVRTRPPQKLLARAIAGYSEGVVGAQVIATLRGISVDDAASELAAAGVIPRSASIPTMAAHELPSVELDLDELLGENSGVAEG